MLRHNFISHETKQLILLRGDLQGTLKNPKCEVLTTPVVSTIRQIEKELAQRGLEPIVKKEFLKVMP